MIKKIESCEEYDNIFSSNKNALILFGTASCSACSFNKAFINEYHAKFPNSLYESFYVDCSQFKSIADKACIKSVPVIFIVKSGLTHTMLSGIQQSECLEKYLNTPE